MPAKPSERPTVQDVELLLEKTRARIEDLVWRHGLTLEAASVSIREAVVALSHRWSRVHDRERWFLDRIEKAARRTIHSFSEEPSDDEEPPS